MKMMPALALLAVATLASCTTIYFDFYTDAPSSSSSTSGTGGASLCTPGATRTCYDGPAGTEGQGICAPGMQTCASDGTSWGPCVGEVLPQPEDCATPEDEDCDGKAPACKGALLWAKRFGDAGSQFGQSIGVDAAGDVFLTGYFGGSVDFGGGSLGSAGENDIFVAKLDPDGNHLWSKSFGGIGGDNGKCLVVDGDGNVLVTGNISGAVDFGGGALPSGGGRDVFVAKLDPNGNHLWSKSFGDGSNQFGMSIAVDGAGNVLLTGILLGSVDFGGGLLTSAGGRDVFVAKLDPNGNHLWSKSFGDAGDQYSVSIAADSIGNAWVAGYFFGSVDFGGGALVSAGSGDAFVAKLDPNGNHLWSKSFGDASDQQALSISVDGSDHALVSGNFSGSIAIDGQPPMAATGVKDIFVAKLNTSGNAVWAAHFGGGSDQSGAGVASDSNGNVLLAGALGSATDFGGGPLPDLGAQDIYLAKLDAQGAHAWSKRFGDQDNQVGQDVIADAVGNVLLTGYMAGGPVSFGTGVPQLVSAGGNDIFVAKFSP